MAKAIKRRVLNPSSARRPTTLHGEIQQEAGQRPAIAITARILDRLVVDSLRKAAEAFQANNVLDGAAFNLVPQIQLFIDNVSVQPDHLSADMVVRGADQLRFTIGPDFSFEIVLRASNNPADEFSRIAYQVTNAHVDCVADSSILNFGESQATVSTQIIASVNRATAITAAGIQESDVVRAEAAFGIIMPQRIVLALLGAIPSFNLRELFPSIELLGSLKFHEASTGHLVIIPRDGINISKPSKCERAGEPPQVDIIPKARAGTDEDAVWEYLDPVFPPPTVKRPIGSDGFVAAYLPQNVLDDRFKEALPSITYRDGKDTFIGYYIFVTVSFAALGVRIDVPNLSLLVDLEFLGDGRAEANVDVPCVGRQRIAEGDIRLHQSYLTTRLRFDMNSNGQLVIVPSVERLDMGDAEVHVQFFSKYLGLAGGKAAVAGFLLDAVIGRILEHNIPIELRRRITESIESNSIPLADLGDFGDVLRWGMNALQPTFSADAASILVGIDEVGLRGRPQPRRGSGTRKGSTPHRI